MDTTPTTKTTRPLELISTQALLEELFSRYETGVFAGHVEWMPEAGLEKVRINWRGNLRTALALTSRLEHVINLVLDEGEAGAVEEA
jgi:hypothetical protein